MEHISCEINKAAALSTAMIKLMVSSENREECEELMYMLDELLHEIKYLL